MMMAAVVVRRERLTSFFERFKASKPRRFSIITTGATNARKIEQYKPGKKHKKYPSSVKIADNIPVPAKVFQRRRVISKAGRILTGRSGTARICVTSQVIVPKIRYPQNITKKVEITFKPPLKISFVRLLTSSLTDKKDKIT